MFKKKPVDSPQVVSREPKIKTVDKYTYCLSYDKSVVTVYSIKTDIEGQMYKELVGEFYRHTGVACGH